MDPKNIAKNPSPCHSDECLQAKSLKNNKFIINPSRRKSRNSIEHKLPCWRMIVRHTKIGKPVASPYVRVHQSPAKASIDITSQTLALAGATHDLPY
jgi:hypothetical protein